MILLTIDTSAASHAAAPTAIDLARRFEQPLRILLVIDGPLRHLLDQEAREQGTTVDDVAAAHLEAVAADARAAGIEVDVVHRHAVDAGPGITDAAAEPDIALVVMATHGRSGLSRFLTGSVTEYVIRHSTVPTVVVPVPDDARQGTEPSR